MARGFQLLLLTGVLSAVVLFLSVPAANAHGAPSSHFVLIHGFGHGAWCWYKITTLLEQAGHQVTAIDLASNGINKAIADSITSLAQYAKPLTDFLENEIKAPQKVILVGHSLGGSIISYAMELFPEKTEKAVFLAAFMPLNNQLVFPAEFLPAFEAFLKQGLVIPNFKNGISMPPTSYSVNLTLIHDISYNESPPQDTSLAKSLLDPTPSAPLGEALTLTPNRYGSIKRFYIKTDLDRTVAPSYQDSFIRQNPPQKVFFIKKSDHSAFFSKPLALKSLLEYIASTQS